MTKNRKRRIVSKRIKILKKNHDISREEAVKFHKENSPNKVHSKLTRIGLITATGMNSKQFKEYCRELLKDK